MDLQEGRQKCQCSTWTRMPGRSLTWRTTSPTVRLDYVGTEHILLAILQHQGLGARAARLGWRRKTPAGQSITWFKDRRRHLGFRTAASSPHYRKVINRRSKKRPARGQTDRQRASPGCCETGTIAQRRLACWA